MVLYDISMAIEPGMAVYKNKAEKKPLIETMRDFSKDTVYESRLGMDMHTGTHIDMPLHMIPSGDTSDYWSPENMFTACAVLDFTDLPADHITSYDLQQKEESMQNSGLAPGLYKTVLLKTKNSLEDEFKASFAYLDKSGADYLVKKEIVGVGIDALGIERNQPGHETHKTLLGSGIWIIEGLRLKDVPEGVYILAVMPLKIMKVEALPARAVLLAVDSLLINKS